MNWYKKIKIAQIWGNTDSPQFIDKIYNIYKLEYQLNAIKSFPFKGLEQRLNNIIKGIERSLMTQLMKVKTRLVQLLRYWLDRHALFDKEKWATSRIQDLINAGMEDQELWDSMFNEIVRYDKNTYYNYNMSPQDILRINAQIGEKIMEYIDKNMEKYPDLDYYIDWLRDDYISNLYAKLQDDGPIEFGENHNNAPFKSEEEAESWIDKKSDNKADIPLDYIIDQNTLIDSIIRSGELEKVATDIYKDIVFENWEEYWSEQGIHETRDRVEQAYKRLIRAKDLYSLISAVNIGLNTVHQGGSILDYITKVLKHEEQMDIDKIEDMLNDLTNGKYIPLWDKELQEIGVNIPNEIIEKNQQLIAEPDIKNNENQNIDHTENNELV